MSRIKAIETQYKGYRFRSRLEARWAVFFDALDIRWEYEPQGFEIGMGYDDSDDSQRHVRRYLPDFRLVDFKTWVEVKGSLDECNDDYFSMLGWAIDWGGQLPDVCDSVGTTKGLLWLGLIPDEWVCDHGAPVHAIIQHDKGGWVNTCSFLADGGLEATPDCDEYFDGMCGGAEIRTALEKLVYGKEKYFRYRPCEDQLRAAYRAARMARFEFGEAPR